MMNKLFTGLFIVLFFSTVQAQTNNFRPELTVGIKMGSGFSRIFSDSVPDLNYNPVFNGGLVLRLMSEKYAGIQLEVNVVQKGWKEKLTGDNSYSRKLLYIEVPLLSHFEIGSRTFKTIINAGPCISTLVSESEKMNITDVKDMRTYYKSKITGKNEFGLCIGLGVAKHTNIGIFELEFRGNIGLSNIFNTDVINADTQNQYFSLDLFYLVPIM